MTSIGDIDDEEDDYDTRDPTPELDVDVVESDLDLDANDLFV